MIERRLWTLSCLCLVVATLLAPASRVFRPAVIAGVRLQAGTLIINEYLADPPDGPSGDANGDGTRDSSQDEFVEVINVGVLPLDIGGFTISDASSVRFTFPASRIPAGDAAVVFGGGRPRGAFGNATANGLVFVAGGSGLSLNNSGDSIIIKDGLGAPVTSLTFGAAEGNASQSITRSPDITGGFVHHSMAGGSGGSPFSPGTRVDGFPFATPIPVITSISPPAIVAGSGPVMLTVTGNNFQSGAQVRVNGNPISTAFFNANRLDAPLPASITNTPGSYAITVQNPDASLSNSVALTVNAPVVLSQIGINEFLADPPDGAAGDANGDGTRDSAQDEFIEIINRTASPIDVGGFTVSDATQVRFTFPEGSIIPSTEVAVIFGGGSPRGDFGNVAAAGLVYTATLSLNNTGDTITIKDRAGNVVESVIFGAGEGGANQSANRNPDIVGTGFALHSTIPDSGGRLFSPGTRTSGMAFTVAPHINSLFPDSAPMGSAPFSLSVRGGGFEPGAIILVDSSPIDTTRVSEDELTAVIPERVTAIAGAHPVRVVSQGGARSNAVVLTIIPPPPLLRLVVPHLVVAGSPSFTLFALGGGFDSMSTVLVDGSSTPTRFVNSSELTATVAAAVVKTAGTHQVSVRNGDGQQSGDLSFEVIPPGSRITSLFPSQTLAGGPDFSLRINGSLFTSRSVVLFDKSQLPTRFVSTTELQADVAARFIEQVGLRGVTVETDGVTSNEAIFRIVAVAPLVSSLEPNAVVEGSGEVIVTVVGERFERGAMVRVLEQDQPGLRLDTSFIDPQKLQARLPAAFTKTAGRLALRVENPDFGISAGVRFDVFVKDPVVINEYLADPPDGIAGDANGDGTRSSAQDEFVEIVNRTSEPIDLSGWKLSDAEAVRHLFPPGTIVPPFEAVLVFGGGRPAGRFGNTAENRLVFVASSGGLSLNNTGDTIKLEDNSGRVVQEIKFGADEGNENQSLNRDPDIDGPTFSLHSRVDPRGRLFSPGARAGGEAFTVKPVIDRLAPPRVRAGSPAFTLAVAGSSFLPGAGVLFGQTLLEAAYRSEGELEALVSSDLVAEGGAVDVRVRNPAGELSSASQFLIVADPPRIASLKPNRTSTGAENLEVILTGERFQRGAKVIIDEVQVETNYLRADGSSPMLVAVLPARYFTQAGTLEIRVLNADGNRSNPVSLIVENGPLITRLSRNRLRAGGAADITVGGIGFKEGAVLFVNDTPVTTKFISEIQIEASIPAALTNGPSNLVLQLHSADGGRSNRVTIRVVE